MSIQRRLALGFVVCGVALGVLEVLARGLEAAFPPPARTIVLPGTKLTECPPSCLPGGAALPVPVQGDWRADNQVFPSGEFRLAPNSRTMHGQVVVRSNSKGLRGPELTAKNPGGLRLMVLGDSTVFGWGVEESDSFSEIAASVMAGELALEVDVVNGAIPGHSTRESLMLLSEVGPIARPDWLIIGNLWSDVAHEDRAVAPLPGSRFALYRSARRLLAPWLPPARIGWIDPSSGRGLPEGGGSVRTQLATYMHNLSKLASAAEAMDARPAFVVLPAPMDLDPAGPAEYIEQYRGALRTVADRHGAPLIEGPRAFEGASLADFYDSVHLSTSGHQRLGDAVARTLLSEMR